MTTSHIGLIGGLAPRAGIFYYEELIQQHKAAGETLNLTMRHADVAAVLDHLSRLDRTWLGTYLGGLANELFAAGADFVAVTAVAPHLAIDEIIDVADGPLVNALDVLADAVLDAGVERFAVFGNRAVMESNIWDAVGETTAVQLGQPTLDLVHDLYNDIALTGKRNTEPEVELLAEFAEQAMSLGAQAIVLAGSDLSSFYSEAPPKYPHIDVAKAHIAQIMATG